MDLSTHRLTAEADDTAFGVRRNLVTLVGPRIPSVLYLRPSYASTLALKLFRGEPAISGFDWNFSPTPSSSPGFSTPVGSGLHAVLPALHPDQG
jgi:hypothetical protein